MDTVINTICVVGIIMFIKNFIHLMMGLYGVREMDVILVRLLGCKIVIGAMMMSLPSLMNIFIILMKIIIPETIHETILSMIIVLGGCLIYYVRELIIYKQSRKENISENGVVK